MPHPSMPALLLAMVRLRTPLRCTASINASGMPHTPKPPIASSIPSRTTPSSAAAALGQSFVIADPAIQSPFRPPFPSPCRSRVPFDPRFPAVNPPIRPGQDAILQGTPGPLDAPALASSRPAKPPLVPEAGRIDVISLSLPLLLWQVVTESEYSNFLRSTTRGLTKSS